MLRVKRDGSVFLTFLTLILGVGLRAFAVDQEVKVPDSAVEAAARTRILNSDEWREVEFWFKEWLSVQVIYDEQEVEQLKVRREQKITTMSPEELREFLASMQSKLAVLMSPEAKEARSWFRRFRSVQAIYSEEELKKMRPDVEKMTASQLQEFLEQLKKNRAALHRQSAVFNQIRQRQVNANQEARRADAAASQRLRSRMASRAAQYRPFATHRRPPSFYAGYMRPPPRIGFGFGGFIH